MLFRSQPRGPVQGDGIHYYGGKGQARITDWGIDMKIYTDEYGSKFEEEGFLVEDAGSIEGLDDKLDGQSVILEMMSRGINSKGKQQPGTHFAEAFKSFAVSQACIEASRTGETIWVPDYWKGLID